MKTGLLFMLSGTVSLLAFFCVIPDVIVYTEELNPDYLCSEEYCQEKVELTPCKALPKKCNETNGGIMLLDPSFCNCCDYCFEYLEEGDDCIDDGINEPYLYESMCGPGLGCDSTTKTCVPLETDCTIKQQKYDQASQDGTLGFTEVRPICDDRGQFLPAHCIGSSICYCTSTEGERIFGELVYSSPSVALTMNCECSRAAWKAELLATEMGVYTQPIHCLQDGSYDLLQCNDDMCQCLDPETKIPDNETRPILEINIMENSPKCFDSSIHVTGKYKRECEEKLLNKLLEIEMLKEEGITAIGMNLPSCQYDGRYKPVMVQDNYEKWCVNPDGELLENHIVVPNSKLYKQMDCNCARTRWMLKNEGVTELPICCDSGNFREMQCRRGKCYCVDCNGNQLALEVSEDEKDTLDCKDTSESCAICPKDTVPLKRSNFVLDWDPKDDDEYLMSNLPPTEF